MAECDKVNGYVYTREEYDTDDNKVNAMFKAAVKSDGFNGRQVRGEERLYFIFVAALQYHRYVVLTRSRQSLCYSLRYSQKELEDVRERYIMKNRVVEHDEDTKEDA